MIDVYIVVAYIIFTVIVGFYAGRNVKTMSDFSISKKAFPTSVLVATIFATWMGGEDLIGVSERVFSVGIIFTIVAWTQFITLLIHAYIIAPKIVRDFPGKFSVGEIMGELYGKIGKIVTGIAVILFSIGFISAQVSSIGYVFNMTFGISYLSGAIIGSTIVILYSSFGGIRSVVFTDVLQFGVLLVAIPLMASIALDNVGGYEALIERLPNSVHINLSNKDFAKYLLLCFVYAFPCFNPALIQRMLMSEDVKQAKKAFFIAGSLYIPFYAIISIIALCALILFPNINPNNAFLTILNQSLPPIIKGIAISGVLAVIMSTADSFLNLASISAIRDISSTFDNKISDKKQLFFSKISTIIIGIVAIFSATSFKCMIDFWLFFSNFWTPTVAAPLLLYMFNVVTSVSHYLIGIASGFTAIFFVKYFVSNDYNFCSQIVGLLVTAFVMFLLNIYDTQSKSQKKLIKLNNK